MNWLVMTPEKEEKVKLIYELLYSIHMDWSEDSLLYDRYILARRLCLNLSNCLKKQRDLLYTSGKFSNKTECLAEYDKYLTGLSCLYDEINKYNPNGTHDGKFFNDDFPYGYRGMLEFFDLVPKTDNSYYDGIKNYINSKEGTKQVAIATGNTAYLEELKKGNK